MNRLSKWDIKRKEENPNNSEKKEEQKRIWLVEVIQNPVKRPTTTVHYKTPALETAKGTSARKKKQRKKK